MIYYFDFFYFLGNAVGGLMIAVYIFIAISQIRFRRHYNQVSGGPLAIKMWLFPYLSYVTIALLAVVYLCQALIESLRSQFYLSTFVLIGSIVLFFIMRKFSSKPVEQIEEKLVSEQNIT